MDRKGVPEHGDSAREISGKARVGGASTGRWLQRSVTVAAPFYRGSPEVVAVRAAARRKAHVTDTGKFVRRRSANLRHSRPLKTSLEADGRAN